MKKKRITYGVSGMMEYQAVIKIGKNNTSILFSDGSVSAMGINPATYTTENIIVQQAIENSPDFKRGRIKTVNTIELEEELRIERPIAPVAKDDTLSAKGTVPDTNTTRDKAKENIPDIAESVRHAIEDNLPEKTSVTNAQPEPASHAIQVEFSCNDDAKDYLEQTFGYVRSKLRNREDIVNAGKANGVEITFV